MKDEDRETLGRRWSEVDRELEELVAGKVQPGAGDLAARETDLHAELDRIEHDLGEEALGATRRLLADAGEDLRNELDRHGPDDGLREALDRAERELDEREKGSAT